jgi:NADPH-dependent 7-cyano-7-deazaguanine reductase QueF
MAGLFYITRKGTKRTVYTSKSGAKFIKSKASKRYLTSKQIKDSHKRATKKIPKKTTKKAKKKVKKMKSRFSLWGG